MPIVKVVRYKTKPESADENERLVRQVFAELAQEGPEGLRYASFRLEGGGRFVHIAVVEGEDNPLSASAAFGQFQSGIRDRCVEGPQPSDATVIGNYGLLR